MLNEMNNICITSLLVNMALAGNNVHDRVGRVPMRWKPETHILEIILHAILRASISHPTRTEKKQIVPRLEDFLTWLMDNCDNGNSQP